MSINQNELSNLMYVLNDLLRNPRKVKLQCTQQMKWSQEVYMTTFYGIPTALGNNPAVFKKRVPTLYFVGTGFGHTVSTISLDRIVSIRELARAGGTLLWAGKLVDSGQLATKAEEKSLADILGL